VTFASLQLFVGSFADRVGSRKTPVHCFITADVLTTMTARANTALGSQ
jgi:hypothetical protein